MTISVLLVGLLEGIFLLYLIALSLFLGVSAFLVLHQQARRTPEDWRPVYQESWPPITLLVPAYREEKTIVHSLESMLCLDYPHLELVVVCDGSPDNTLGVLQTHFDLQIEAPFPAQANLTTQPVETSYRSRRFSNLRVLRWGMPVSRWARFQAIEYVRAFLLGRFGWNQFGTVLIISGAFGLFRREEVVACGGWDTRTVGEDFELVLRLLEQNGRRVCHVPEAACWTEVPETRAMLKSQWIRWHRGLIESLHMHPELFRHPDSMVRMLGWYFRLFEEYAPWVESAGFILTLIMAFSFDGLYWRYAALFTLSNYIGLVIFSLLAVLLDFRYPESVVRHWSWLHILGTILVEPIGYQPFTLVWRIIGTYRHWRGVRAHWEAQTRHGFRSIDKG
jgi:cellulose synthase/poly-beta-1,6-N-acetylglucosamine synthase-like glycosyltransferase